MSNMSFNTATMNYRQLLGNGMTYNVPPFQRDYSWDEEEWEDLWQDVLALFAQDAEEVHYLGYLVLQSPDGRQFAIIDGQQRLTTLSIIVLSALWHLDRLGEEGISPEDNRKRSEQLRNSFIGYLDPVTLISSSKLRLNTNNDAFYQAYIVPLEAMPQRNINASEQLLRKAVLWFRKRVSEYMGEERRGERLAGFLEDLSSKMVFSVIYVTDELNAFKVFETLNARGVRLSSTDLLKNYLFSVIHAEKTHHSEIKTLDERWNRIAGNLGEGRFTDFLQVFWNSRNEFLRKTDLFKAVKRSVSDRKQVFDLIRDLDRSADAYSALQDPESGIWDTEEREILRELELFHVKQHLSMLLSAFLAIRERDRPTFLQILRLSRVMAFRYNVICTLHTHALERVYSQTAVGIFSGELSSPRDILRRFRAVYPEDDDFRAAFARKTFTTSNSRNSKVVRYILFSLEKHLSAKDLDQESKRYTLEHIMPEHPGEDWMVTDDMLDAGLPYRIGNFTLLDAKRNREAANETFSAKKDLYLESEFEITKRIIAEYPEWDEETISLRQEWLAKQAAAIWRIQFDK